MTWTPSDLADEEGNKLVYVTYGLSTIYKTRTGSGYPYTASNPITGLKLTRTGYDFLGFALSKDETSADNCVIKADGTLKANWNYAEDKELFAIWQIKTYKLTLNSKNAQVTNITVMGGEDEIEGVSGVYTISYGYKVRITFETNDGYSFTGFTGDVNPRLNGDGYEFNMPAKDITLTLNTAPNYIQVELDKNDSEGATKADALKYSSIYIQYNSKTMYSGRDASDKTKPSGNELTTLAPTRAGYTFKGWATQPSGTVITNAQGVLNENWTVSSVDNEVTLYAIWEKSTSSFVVQYYFQGITDNEYHPDEDDKYGHSNREEEGTTDTSVTQDMISGYAVSITGFTYAGQYVTNQAGNGLNINGDEDNQLVITLHYNRRAFNLTVNFNGNGTGNDTKNGRFESEITIADPTRTGYTFNGWTAQGVGTITDNDGNITYKFGAGNETITAQWLQNVTTITLDKGGDNSVTLSHTTIYARYDDKNLYSINPYGKTDEELAGSIITPDATKTAYDFLGFYDTNNNIIITNKGKINVNNGVWNKTDQTLTLTARFNPHEYSITYKKGVDANGAEMTDASITGTQATYNIVDGFTTASANVAGYQFNGWKVTKVNDNTTGEFGGWTVGKSYNGATEVGENKYGDIELTAQWTPLSYTIKYDANDDDKHSKFTGTLPQSQTVNFDSEVTIANAITLEGYTFTGWQDSEGNNFTAGEEYTNLLTPTANGNVITLYAQWEIRTYDLTVTIGTLEHIGISKIDIFKVVGEDTTSLDSVTIEEGTVTIEDIEFHTRIQLDPDFTSGYQFDKWDAKVGESAFTIGSDNLFNMPAGNLSVTGWAEPQEFEISYRVGAGGTIGGETEISVKVDYEATGLIGFYNVVADEKVIATDETGATEILPTREGYIFTGWAEQANATSVKYKNGYSYTHETTGQYVLYAQWQAKTFNVRYNNGDENITDKTKATFSQEYTFLNATQTGFSKTGYVLKGWATSEGSDEVTYSPEQKFTWNICGNEDNNYTYNVYAVWEAITYNVYFSPNDGSVEGSGVFGTATGTVSSLRPTYNDLKTITDHYELAGYTFAGWTSKNEEIDKLITNNYDADSKVYTSTTFQNLVATQDGSITLYAIWVANDYKIIINATTSTTSPETLTNVETKDVTFGATYIEIIEDTTKYDKVTGYNLAGFYIHGGTGTTSVMLIDKNGDILKGVSTIDTKMVTDSEGRYRYAGNITVDAVYVEEQYTVVFNGNPRPDREDPSATVDPEVSYNTVEFGGRMGGAGEEGGLLPTPVFTGYILYGWSTRNDYYMLARDVFEEEYASLVSALKAGEETYIFTSDKFLEENEGGTTSEPIEFVFVKTSADGEALATTLWTVSDIKGSVAGQEKDIVTVDTIVTKDYVTALEGSDIDPAFAGKDGKINLYAIWVGRNDVTYEIYYLQKDLKNVDGATSLPSQDDLEGGSVTLPEKGGHIEYTYQADNDTSTYLIKDIIEYHNAITGSPVEMYIGQHNYTGFLYRNYEYIGDVINAVGENDEGHTIIFAFFERIDVTLNLTYDAKQVQSVSATGANGQVTGSNGTYTVKYGETVNLTINPMPGYSGGTWTQAETDSSSVNVENGQFIFNVTDTVNLKATATADTDTPYTVEYYYMKTDGTYGATADQTLSGTVGTTDTDLPFETHKNAGIKDGFTYDYYESYKGEQPVKDESEETLNIDGDGNRLIKIYYEREQYSFSINTSNTNGSSIVLKVGGKAQSSLTNVKVYYGQSVEVVVTVNAGYTLTGYTSSNPELFGNITLDDDAVVGGESATNTQTFEMPLGGFTLTANISRNTDTPFTAHIMFEKRDITGLTGHNKYEDKTVDFFTDGNATGTGTTEEVIKEANISEILSAVEGNTKSNGFKLAGFGAQMATDGSATTLGNVTIEGDGSSEVYIYFNRMTGTLTVNYLYGEDSNKNGTSAYEAETFENVRFGETRAAEAIVIAGYESEKNSPYSVTAIYDTNSGIVTGTTNVYYNPVSYTITYNTVAGETFDIETARKSYTIEDGFTFTEPTKTGYGFKGWAVSKVTEVGNATDVNYNATGNWVVYVAETAETTYTTITAGKYGNITLYAVWGAEMNDVITSGVVNITFNGNLKAESGLQYTATLKANDGYKLPSSITITMSDSNLTSEQYSYTITEGSDNKEATLVINANVINQDIAIQAEGIALNFMVKFDLNDTGNGSTTVESVVVGENTLTINDDRTISLYVKYNTNFGTLYTTADGTTSITLDALVSAIERTGYTFSGFDTEELSVGEGGADYQVDITSTTSFATSNNNTVVYGYWTANTNTAYKVEHRLMNLDGTTYKLEETDELEGTTDSLATSELNSYEGFTAPTLDTTTTISAEGDTVIVYKYTRNIYTVTLEKPLKGIESVSLSVTEGAVGGVNSSSTGTIEVYYDGTVVIDATASAGYTFSGNWTSEGMPELTTTTGTAKQFKMPDKDVTYTAVATANVYEINLVANNKVDEAEDEDGTTTLYLWYDNGWYSDKTHNSPIEEIDLPTRVGYAFAGYNTVENPTEENAGTTIIDRDGRIVGATNFTTTDKTKIYAQWEIKEYKLTINYIYANKTEPDNIAAEPTVEQVEYKDSYTKSDLPKITGYQPYNSDDEVISKVTVDSMPAEEVVITVTYKPNTYTVKFDKNASDATNTMSDQTLTYDATVALTQNAFARDGYTFAGWAEQSDGSGKTFADNQEITMNKETFTGFDESATTQTFTLYAQWSANTNTEYKVEVFYMNTNGEYEDAPSETKTYRGETASLVEVSVSGDGKTITFANNGNNNAISKAGFTVDDSHLPQNAEIAGDGSTTFKVYFERDKHTLTLEKDAGITNVTYGATDLDDTLDGYQYFYGSTVSISATVSAGYTWKGWSLTEGAEVTGDLTKDATTITIGLGDTTLTATTTINPYKLYIDLGDEDATYEGYEDLESDENGKYIEQNYQTSYTLKTPGLVGYNFTGWTIEGLTSEYQPTLSGSVYTFGAGHARVTATWDADRYEVTINLNDKNALGLGSTSVGEIEVSGFTDDHTKAEDVTKEITLSPEDGTLTLYVVYDGTYGKLYVNEDKVDENDDYLALDTLGSALTRVGYTFTKFTLTNASGETVTSQNTFAQNSGVTLFTNWEVKPHTLTIVAENGSVAVSGSGVTPIQDSTTTFTAKFDGEVTLTATANTGYHFVNFTSSDVTTSSENPYTFTYTFDKDVTVTANFAPNSYTIEYDANGGSGEIDPESAEYDETITLSDGSGFNKVGYTFAGWAGENGAEIEGLEYNEETSTWTALNLTATDGDTVTLYAQWTANKYDVTFNEHTENWTTAPEGTITTLEDLEDVAYDTAVEIVNGTSLERQGYTLAGYNRTGTTPAGVTTVTEENVSGFEGSDAEKVTAYLRTQENASGVYLYNNKYYVFNLTTGTDSVEIHAVWTESESTYRVEYYLEKIDGTYVLDNTVGEDFAEFIGTPNTSDKTGTTGQEVEIEEKAYTGFVVDNDNAGNVRTGIVQGDGKVTTLKLYYNRTTHTVQVNIPEFETGITGVTRITGTTGTYKYNQEVEIEATIKDGYSFVSYTEGSENTVVSSVNPYTFNIKGNRTLTINLTRGTYDLTIKHTFQTLDGTYVSLETIEDTVVSTFGVDHVVTEQDLEEYKKSGDEIKGYEFESFELNDAVITTDGKAEVTIKYSRMSYTLSLFQANTGVQSVVATEGEFVVKDSSNAQQNYLKYQVVYGAEVELTYTLKNGYTFDSWGIGEDSGVTIDTPSDVSALTGTGTIEEMPTNDVSISVTAEAGKVRFKIEYWLQDIVTGEYSEHADEYDDSTQVATTDAPITNIQEYNLAEIKGYKLETWDGTTEIKAPTISDGQIDEDSLTIIKVYYDLSKITINVTVGTGVQSVTLTTSGYYQDFNINETLSSNGRVEVVYGAKVVLTQELEEGYDVTFTNENYKLSYGDTSITASIDGETIYFNVPAETVSLTVTTASNEYTITFNNNGGEGSIPAQTARYNEEITLTTNNNQIHRTGYIFNGWQDEDGTPYNDGAKFVYTYTKDIVLYAQWTPITYTLTYNGNDGEGQVGSEESQTSFAHTASLTYDKAEALRSDIVWKKVGYTFAGWSLTNGSYQNVAQEITDENMTGVEGATDVDKVTNYLKGQQNATGIYLYNGTYYAFNLTSKQNASTNIYVAWDENTYTIEYNSNYGVGEEKIFEDENILYTATVDIKTEGEAGFAKTGYIFTGWAEKSDGSGQNFLPDQEGVSKLVISDDGVYKLFAQWRPSTYKVNFDKNEETAGGETTEVTATYDEATPLTVNAFSYLAYDFIGWTETAGGTTSDAKVIATGALDSVDGDTIAEKVANYAKAQTEPRGIYLYEGTYYAFNLKTDGQPITLYAVWEAHEYTITYDTNGGEFVDEDATTQTYTIESESVALFNNSNITKTGNKLVGYTVSATSGTNNWETSIDLVFEENDEIGEYILTAGKYGDVTLKAVWEKRTYTLTINYVYDNTCADDVKGGNVAEAHTEQVGFEDTFRVSSVEKDGYEATDYTITLPVSGYTLGESATSELITGVMPASDVTITVYYSPIEITLTLDYNVAYGTTGEVTELTYQEIKVKYGFTYATATALVLEATEIVGLDKPTREGYTFAGWYLDANCSDGKLIDESTIMNLLDNQSIYAKWTANTGTAFTVEYHFENLDDENFTINETYTQSGTGTTDETITLEMIKALTTEGIDDSTTEFPVVTGFTVNTDKTTLPSINADGETKVVIYYERDDKALKVEWGENVTNVQVEVLGEDNQVIEDDSLYIREESGTYYVRFEAKVQISATFAEGYEFDKFELKTGTIDGFTSALPLAFTMKDDITLALSAKAKGFTITYHANYEGNESTETQDGTFNTELTIEENTFTRTGYTFKYWSTSPSDEGTRYEPSDTYTMTTTYQDNIDLYAIWEANEYSFSINLTDPGILSAGVHIEVDDEEQTSLSTIYYDQKIEIIITVDAIKKGYDFTKVAYTMDVEGKEGDEAIATGENTTAPVEASPTTLTFTVTGKVTAQVTTTPKTDSQIKVVYALRNLDTTVAGDVELADTYAIEEVIFAGATTDKIVNEEYLKTLTNSDGSAFKSFTGFNFIRITEDLNSTEETGVIKVIYNNAIGKNEDAYTTVYLTYERLHYGLKLNTINDGEGVQEFSANGQIAGTVNKFTDGAYDEYRVKYEAPVNIVLGVIYGYDFNGFDITVYETSGLVNPDDEEQLSTGHALQFEQAEQSEVGVGTYYYTSGEERIDVLTLTYEDGHYVLNKMPNYYVSIEADVTPKEYTVTYHNEDKTTTADGGKATFNDSYTFKSVELLSWTKDGYEFIGWAISEEDLEDKKVTIDVSNFNEEPHQFVVTFNQAYAQYANEENELHLYAVWSAGSSQYKVEYYFENFAGTFVKDEYERTKYGETDGTGETTGEEGVQIEGPDGTMQDEGIRVGYEIDTTQSVLSGKITADDSLILKVYYKLKTYTLTIESSGNFSKLSASSSDYTITGSEDTEGEDTVTKRVFTVTVKYGAKVTLSAEPVAGYKLKAFNSIDVQIGTDNSFNMPEKNVKVTAVEEALPFTLTFVGGDEGILSEVEGTMDEQTFIFKVPQNITLNKFKRDGYVFAGWKISGDTYQDEKTYTDGQLFTFTVAENLTATAQWTPASANYTINFKIQGTTLVEDNVAYFETRVTGSGTTEAEITKGMVDAYLKTALQNTEGIIYEEGMEAFFTFDQFEQENVTITGDGKASVTVTYNRVLVDYTIEIGVGSQVSMMTATYLDLTTKGNEQVSTTEESMTLNLQVAYGIDVKLTATYVSGYEFGSILRYIGENLDQLDETFVGRESEGVITLNNNLNKSAKYVLSTGESEFTFTYNENFKGGIASTPSAQTQESAPIAFNEIITLAGNIWNHTGYTFKGWATTAEAEEAEYEPNATIQGYEYEDWNGKILYAVWEANSYTINYIASHEDVTDDEENPMTATEAIYDQVIELRTSTFTRTGFTFAGWAFNISADNESSSVAKEINASDIEGETGTTTLEKLANYLKKQLDAGGIYYIESEEGDITSRTYYALNLVSQGEEDLYTVWTPLTYSIKFHYDESNTKSPVASGDIEYGKTYNLPIFNSGSGTFAGWTKKGYEFGGWYYTIGDETKYLYIEPGNPATQFEIKNLATTQGDVINFYVFWTKGSTTYTVYVDYQDIKGDYGVQRELYSSAMTAITDSKITPYSIYADPDNNFASFDKDGFIVENEGANAQSVNIEADGSTKIYIQYSRIHYKLTLTNSTGIASSKVDTTSVDTDTIIAKDGYYEVFYGALVTITSKVKVGYNSDTIVYTSDQVEISNGVIASMPASEVTVLISASPFENIEYTVNIYLADETNAFEETATVTLGKDKMKDGVTDEEISIITLREKVAELLAELDEPIDLSVYEFKESKGDTIFKGDGTSEVSLYYNRQTYTVTYGSNMPVGVNSKPETSENIFGSEVTAVFVLNEGYKGVLDGSKLKLIVKEVGEDGLNGEVYALEYTATQSTTNVEEKELTTWTVKFTMPTQDINIEISIEAEDVTYTIIYQYQSADLTDEDGTVIYDDKLKQTESETAKTGTNLTYEDLGFTEIGDTGHWTYESEKDGFQYYGTSMSGGFITVLGDGSTTVYINFTRIPNKLVITYEDPYSGLNGKATVTVQGKVREGSGDITTDTFSVAYGQEVEISFGMKDGYSFNGFTIEAGLSEGEYDANNEDLKITFTMKNNEIKLKISISPDSAKYTVKYYLQKTGLNNEEFDAQNEANYEYLEWTVQPDSVTNERIDSKDIQENFIDGIASLGGYVADNFVGFDMTDYWFYASYKVLGEDHKQNIGEAVSVTADGSTTIHIFINRQVVEVNIEIDNTNQVNNSTIDQKKDYLYGDVVKLEFETNAGYLFDYLTLNNGEPISASEEGPLKVVHNEERNIDEITYEFTITDSVIDDETKNVNISIFSKAGTAKYTIKIFKQLITENMDGEEPTLKFEELEPIVLTGTTDSTIVYTEYTIAEPGYEYDEHRGNKSTTIAGDGSSFVEIYFMLGRYEFTIEMQEGIESAEPYSEYNTVKLTEDNANGVRTYQVYFTDRIGFDIVETYGYVFEGIDLKIGDGEFKEEANSTEESYRMTVPTENFTVRIRAHKEIVMVYYHPNTGAQNEEPTYEAQQFGNIFNLKVNEFTRDGYTFKGWATTLENAQNGIVEFTDGAEYEIKEVGDLHFYAVWEENASMPWWIWLVIGLAILLLIIIIIIIIIVVKKKKEKDKIRSR